MADLTPEMLAQLERDAAGFGGRFEATIDEDSDSVHYVGLNCEYHEIIADCEIDDVVEPLARMLNAVGPLVAAAKERVQLRAEVERLRSEAATALRRGFDIAVDHAEVSTWDGWHVTDPRIGWDMAEEKIRTEIERKP